MHMMTFTLPAYDLCFGKLSILNRPPVAIYLV